VVDVEALDVDASFLNFLRTSAVVLNPDAEAEPLVLQQIGPGRYRGEFRTDRDGAYLININFVGGSAESRMEGNIQAAVSVPYPAEYRAVKHNAALLREVAERTGGRVLAADPLIAGLFDRSALEVPRSPRSVWDLLAIIAAAIFVLDVATRRISIDRRAVAEAARRAVGKRAEVGDATMAAWKRVASRRPDAAKGETVQAQQHFEAGEADQELAIDAGAEQAGTFGPNAAPAARTKRPTTTRVGSTRWHSSPTCPSWRRRWRTSRRSRRPAPASARPSSVCAPRSPRRSSARTRWSRRRSLRSSPTGTCSWRVSPGWARRCSCRRWGAR
jgi:hypothetical protein